MPLFSSVSSVDAVYRPYYHLSVRIHFGLKSRLSAKYDVRYLIDLSFGFSFNTGSIGRDMASLVPGSELGA